jgi:GLPGLI family protein
MKKILSFMMVTAIIMGFASTAISKDFSGVITYKISYPGMEIDASMAAMMPKMATLSIKENMSKFEISMGQMGKQIQIIDGEAKTVTTVMDMMGQKFYYVESEDEIMAEEGSGDVKVDIKDETKEIAGYECTKAVVTVTESGEEMMFTVFFTEEIGSSSLNIDNPYFKEIPGAMLEFEIDTGAGTMKMEALSIDKKKLSDADFEVPEGYEKKTSAEIKQMFGGGM